MKKFWKKTEGFTLVELIVVIAILGILAGIGTVGYSGYVKKANMAADQQLIADIVYAAQLEHITNAIPDSTVSYIVLDTDGIVDTDADTDTWYETALKKAYGNDLSNLKLQYGKWGNGAAVTQDAITHFSNGLTDEVLGIIYSGDAAPSFANDVNDLFVLLKDTAVNVGSNLGQSGADLVQGAAGKTLNGATASNFATAWAASAWSNSILGSNDDDYDEDAGKLEGTSLEAAVANAAAIKARNTAFAGYLSSAGYSELYNVFADYTYGNSAVPKDACGEMLTGSGATVGEAIMNAYLEKNPDASETDIEKYLSDVSLVVYDYYGMNEDGDPPADVTTTKAYTDGLAYYAMMDTVDSVNTDSGETSDDTYWDEMSAAVSLYGSIAAGDVKVTDLQTMYNEIGTVGENSVVITAMGSEGQLSINVSPSAAMPK